jgi:hypothetical protein
VCVARANRGVALTGADTCKVVLYNLINAVGNMRMRADVCLLHYWN